MPRLKSKPEKKIDRRRRHSHFQVKIFYQDNEVFCRVYTNKGKAVSFAGRQKKSPLVKQVSVKKIS